MAPDLLATGRGLITDVVRRAMALLDAEPQRPPAPPLAVVVDLAAWRRERSLPGAADDERRPAARRAGPPR